MVCQTNTCLLDLSSEKKRKCPLGNTANTCLPLVEVDHPKPGMFRDNLQDLFDGDT